MDSVNEDSARHAALELLGDIRRSDETNLPLESALSPDFWRGLNPSLSIGDEQDAQRFESAELRPEDLPQLREKVRVEGYFKTKQILDTTELNRLRAGIETLRAEGLPAGFCLVYDQFWLLARTPSLVQLVATILGPQYRQSWWAWCNYVEPVRAARGWHPHRDGSHQSDRMTVWIPVTDASLDNGCMYVIPKDKIDPQTTLEEADARTLLHATRALPARPGEVLGWDFDVIHWGSSSSDAATEPRVSLSQVFIARSWEPSGEVLFDVSSLPSFEERLYAICHGLLHYGKFELTLTRYADLARRLGARIEPTVREQALDEG
jgi:Phytanoyl-CoA dioxygenase (PhyH)